MAFKKIWCQAKLALLKNTEIRANLASHHIIPSHHYKGILGCRRQGWEFLLYGSDKFLDGIDFLLFEVGFATLDTDPCRHFVESNMTALAVSVEGGMASLHFALAVDALHCLALAVVVIMLVVVFALLSLHKYLEPEEPGIGEKAADSSGFIRASGRPLYRARRMPGAVLPVYSSRWDLSMQPAPSADVLRRGGNGRRHRRPAP